MLALAFSAILAFGKQPRVFNGISLALASLTARSGPPVGEDKIIAVVLYKDGYGVGGVYIFPGDRPGAQKGDQDGGASWGVKSNSVNEFEHRFSLGSYRTPVGTGTSLTVMLYSRKEPHWWDPFEISLSGFPIGGTADDAAYGLAKGTLAQLAQRTGSALAGKMELGFICAFHYGVIGTGKFEQCPGAVKPADEKENRSFNMDVDRTMGNDGKRGAGPGSNPCVNTCWLGAKGRSKDGTPFEYHLQLDLTQIEMPQ